ncbi:dolichol-phosphate mannosyltransferase/undecaprenyl-phosphate 4-deoxy-4-formamido-L-arabinose transferase [Salegentibacter echinorum]|uniref:Dolichol-phosphate mannosyltransferase/undecaprenyl-phosphate 4-deoxy-4-formamido-L-arabinose transferase n=1 Tax=Salegentibacter echinorum TaxID=1073325 RepID=A0A1M5FH49_SALEC|nr:glycosyltransferase [Salegentibacter echinorum]SHF90808.1 dolichol-phosphate mannosyltransferase/undecaprenyl-phosphate 4-deoxy-4-formamido-L-arabinose transferase [Salegentibacter echinorum]
MPLYSVIIPVYKSTQSLETIAVQINELQKQKDYKFEIIFVNDSPFFLDTVRTMEQLEKKYENVRTFTLRRNLGQQFAVLCGIQQASGDYIMTMDDDLQHPVKEIPKLINAFHKKDKLEAIFAIPNFKDRRHDRWRNVGSYVMNKIDTVFLKKPKGLYKSSFRIMTLSLAKAIVNNYNATPAVSSLIIYTTDKIENIEIEHNSRQFGKSNFTLRKLINHSLNNLLHYSSAPLKALGLIGVIVFLASVLFIIYIVLKKLFFGSDFPGYASTVSLISFFGGLNLFGIGLLGEYLIRILREQQKPKLEDLLK